MASAVPRTAFDFARNEQIRPSEIEPPATSRVKPKLSLEVLLAYGMKFSDQSIL